MLCAVDRIALVLRRSPPMSYAKKGAIPSAEGGKTGYLLINLGTPDAPERAAVARYLREFLMDPRVIDLAWPLRAFLVHGIIAPFRSAKSAEAYAKIWTAAGSPLLLNTLALGRKVATRLEPSPLAVAMRYQNPSIRAGLEQLLAAGVCRIVVCALFPQESEATTGSVRVEVGRRLKQLAPAVALEFTPPFFDEPGFIGCQARLMAAAIRDFSPDAVIASYHGLPERRLRQADSAGHCLVAADCCGSLTAVNAGCYRAQCHATTRALAAALDLPAERIRTTFQSRLGRARWIEPYTDRVVDELARAGTRRILVVSPAFTADCLETLEELCIRLRESFRAAGGEDLRVAPCVNAEEDFADAVAGYLRAPTER